MTVATESVIRSAINFEKRIFSIGLQSYEKRLKEFEKRYSMSCEEFIERYENGELGDDEKWFDWLFEYKAYKHLKKRLELMENIA